MKLSKFSKQIIAVVMAFALVLVSNCFMTGTANAAAPSGWTKMGADGTTAGGWKYYTGGAGGSAGSVYYTEGNNNISLYVDSTTNNQWGIQIWSPLDTSLTADSTYRYTITFDADQSGTFYTKEDKSNSALLPQNFTSGSNTVTGTFTANAAGAQVLLADFRGVSNGTTLSNITITYSPDTTTAEPAPTTGADGYYEVAPSGVEKTITTGGWTLYQGPWGSAHIGYKDAQDDSIDLKMYSSNGQAGCWAAQAKYTISGLTAGTTYDFVADYDSSAAGTMFIKLEGVDDGATSSATAGNNQYTKSSITGVTSFVVVFELSGFAANTTIDINSLTVTPHAGPTESTEEPTTAENTCAQNAWTFVDDPGTTGWQYFVANADSTYEGGTSINDPLVINYGTYVQAADTCQARSPITGVVSGTSCEGSITVGNSSIYNMENIQASVYAVDKSTTPYTYTWYHASKEGAQTAPAGGSATFTFDYTAPDTGFIVYVIDTSYSPTAALTFSATHSGEEPTTPTPTTTAHTEPCSQAAWTFAGPNDTGWQYYVANADSTYSGGTDIDTPLAINYGTYVEAADTCQARSPVTAVVGGTSCAGSITVDNPSIYTMQNIQASVYAVDTSTTPYTYTWYHASEEGPQSASAGGSATFTFDYTAPDTGYIVYVIDTSYSPTATLTFSATHSGEEPTTEQPTTEVPTEPCSQAEWSYAGPNDTGWQYYVANADSTYSGGTDIDTPLEINYGTYVESADTCQARSPITEVIGGTTCIGSITVSNASAYTMQNVQAGVYAVDTSTTPYTYTWYASPTEGAQEVPAGGSATFNFNYTAPNIGYIVYVADTSYSPTGKLTFSATHNGAYDVTDYKESGTYPEKDGKIFAGWYTDITYGTPYMGSTGAAYAKFIDEKVLDVKFQKKNDKTAVRFVSTIDDCLDYESVGFKFTGDYGAKHIDTEKSCTKVYKNINADGKTLTPSTAFDNTDSAYFFTYSVRNMDGTTSSTWIVTPFYVTPDGTKVYGTTKDYSM